MSTVPSGTTGSRWDKDVASSSEAKELQLIFSGFYLTDDGNYDQVKGFDRNPTHATINGILFGNAPAITKTKRAMLLHLKLGNHVSFFLLNEVDLPVNLYRVSRWIV